ncbi:HNH endonuclease, partial [Streptomyces sp. F63]|nr:HNH endonuclease [Streptomyces sp. F63]
MQATLLDHGETGTTTHPAATAPGVTVGDTGGGASVGMPVSADEWAAHLASAVPGPQTAAMLGLLKRGELSRAGRIDALRAWERHIAWIQAQQVGLLADIEADALEAVP